MLKIVYFSISKTSHLKLILGEAYFYSEPAMWKRIINLSIFLLTLIL